MINKDAFIKAVAEKAEGTQKEARKYVGAVQGVVVDALEAGQDIKLKGFVDFTSKEVAEGQARNPQTGETVVVPAHRKAKATLAKSLRKF